MAYTITESRESRTFGIGRQAFAELVYTILENPIPTVGPDTEKNALDAVVGAAPASFQGLPQVGARIRPLDGRSLWRVTIQYGLPVSGSGLTPLEAGEYRVTFPGGARSELITQAYNERRYGSGDPAPPALGGAINVTGSGVEGVNVDVPDFPWVETWIVANADVSWADIIGIGLLRKTTNDDAFRGFARGEVLFDEFSASPRTDDDWEYTFRFRSSPNRINGNANGGADMDTPLQPDDVGYVAGLDRSITIGNISGIDKLGWEYLWVAYQSAVSSAGLVFERPVGVYVNRVYLESDFADLGIGTSSLF